MTTETALVVRDDDGPRAIVPRTFSEAREMAEYLGKGSLLPAAIKTSAFNVFAIIAAGAELGLPPMASLRAFHVIEGVPRLAADALVAICLSRPDLCEYFYPVEQNDSRATWATKRRGAPGEVRRSWDAARAEKAGLTGKGTWRAHQPRMLSARAKAELARDVYPDLCSGYLAVEEDVVEAPEAFERPKIAGDIPATTGDIPATTEEPKRKRGRPPKEAVPEPVVEDADVIDKETEACEAPPDLRAHLSQEDVPQTMIDFRKAQAEARTDQDMRNVRAKFVPWSQTPEGQPWAEAMRVEHRARLDELAGAK